MKNPDDIALALDKINVAVLLHLDFCLASENES